MNTMSMPEVTEPKFEWGQKDGCDVLLVHLPGYKREDLRVQVTTSRNLRVLGERKINDKKAFRFQKEFSLSDECDINGITAKFEGVVLQVRLPKTPAAAAAAGVLKEEGKRGAASRTTEEEQKTSALDKAGRKDLEQEEEKIADAVEEAEGRAARKGKSGKMYLGKMIRKKTTMLALIVVVAGVAVALSLGLLH